MYYCGIDIAMKSSYIYITDNQGHKKTSGQIPTTADVFRQRLKPYVQAGLSVAIEAGNQTAFTMIFWWISGQRLPWSIRPKSS